MLRVHTNSSQEKIQKSDKGYEVWVKEKPIEGKANEKIVKLFKKKLKKNIKIISGLRSNNKIIEVS
jgi:uncharacterized protein (TIGR00251 family)